MVRLKDRTGMREMNRIANFNSTMVRLKEPTVFERAVHRLFQFHYGTIKRLNSLLMKRDEVLFQFHYGTIKSCRIYVSSLFNLYFNSTMVRLKGNSWPQYGHLSSHFNSTMVRLKERYQQESSSIAIFQFHYGTIKSLKMQPQATAPYQISIPLWYD